MTGCNLVINGILTDEAKSSISRIVKFSLRKPDFLQNVFSELEKKYTIDYSENGLAPVRENIEQILRTINNAKSGEILLSLDLAFSVLIDNKSNDDVKEDLNPDPVEGKVEDFSQDSVSNKFDFDSVYKGLSNIQQFGLTNLKTALVSNLFVDFDSGEIKLGGNEKLNVNIANTIETLYKNLYDYIKEYDRLTNVVSYYKEKFYDEKGNPDLDAKRILLNRAKDIFSYDSLQSDLLSSFANISDTDNRLFLNAFNAFNLLSDNNFDNALKTILGKNIGIKSAYKNEVNVKWGKYSLKSDNLETTWNNNENVDAIEFLGSVGKILIEQTPMLNYRTGLQDGVKTLSMNQFLYSMNKLSDNRTITEILKKNDNLTKLFRELHDNPVESLRLILETIINDKRNIFVESGIKSFDKNVFRSVYEMFFNPKGNAAYNYSLYQIVLNQQIKGIYNYSLLDAVAALVDRSQAVKYLEYEYDFEYGGVVPKTISTSSEDKARFAIENDVEISTQNRVNKEEFLQKYNVSVGNYGSGTMKYSTADRVYDITLSNKKLFVERNKQPIDLKKPTDINIVKSYLSGNISVLDSISDSDRAYIEIIKMVSDVTGIELLKNNAILLEVLRNEYGVDNLTHLNDLVNLVNGVFRATYVYANSNKTDDLVSSAKKLFPFYSKNINTKEFYNSESESLRVLNTNELGLYTIIGISEQLISGEIFKSNVKNAERNAIPNNRISNLAKFDSYWINKNLSDSSSPLRYNLFHREGQLMGQVIKTDSKNSDGEVKSVSNFTESEWNYTSIVYDFFYNLLPEKDRKKDYTRTNNDYVVTYPMTLSDKRTYIAWLTKYFGKYRYGKSDYRDFNLKTDSIEQIDDVIKSTLGGYYKQVYNNLLEDYTNIYSGRLGEFISRLDEKTANSLRKKKNFTYTEWAKILSVTSEEEIISLGVSNGVNVIENIHYNSRIPVVNGGVAMNTLIPYNALKRYDSDYDKRQKYEEVQYIYDLLRTNTQFNMGIYKPNIIDAIIKYFGVDSSWINAATKSLITGKYKGEEIKNDPDTLEMLQNLSEKERESVELNPILQRFMRANYLLTQNLKIAVLGSELNHPSKINNESLSFEGAIKEDTAKSNAQNKRTVVIPGSVQNYTLNTVHGVPSKVRRSIIKSITKPLTSLAGYSVNQQVHDGSTFNNPLATILENKSLQDSSVGEDIKDLGHDSNSRYSVATLVKHASFSSTNARMRSSQMSDINLYDLFKRMSSFDINQVNSSLEDFNTHYSNLTDEQRNLLENYQVDFTKDLLGGNLSLRNVYNDKLFFTKNGKHYLISNIVKNEDGGYARISQEVDQNGELITGQKIIESVVINSLFDLHLALGGIHSESLIDRELSYSDASLHAVVGYINNVGVYFGQTDNFDLPSELMTQSNTWQPLKYKFIYSLNNDTAVKNGIANINQKEAFFDPNIPLNYVVMNYAGTGVQMNADHVVTTEDGSDMTEPSQVIQAISANGYSFDNVKRVYNSLAKVAELEVRDINNAVAQYIDSNFSEDSKTAIYDIIGKAVINKLRNDDSSSLAKEIVDSIQKNFKVDNLNHKFDFNKIPFSDPSMFSITVSTINSMLNKTAIKKKLSGIGSVLAPSDGIVMNFKLPNDNDIYGFDDLERMTIEYNQENGYDLTVREYLELLQDTYIGASQGESKSNLMPQDSIMIPMDQIQNAAKAENVDVELYMRNHKLVENNGFASIRLENVYDYIYFKDNENITSFYYNYTSGQNLKPQEIYW